MIGSFYKTFLTVSTWLVAGLLIGAGLLKGSEAFTEVYYFGILDGKSSLLTLLIVLCEIGIGLFLWKNRNCRYSWLITSGLFVCFALVSLFEGLAGVQSCDCFGAVQVRPYYTATLDAVMAVISFSCFLLLKKSEERLHWGQVYSSAIFLLIFFHASLAFFFLRETSVVAKLLNQAQIVSRFDLKNTKKEGLIRGDILLSTRSGKPLRIIGYTAQNCAWRIPEGKLPLTLERSKIQRLPIAIKPPQKGAVGLVTIYFYLEEGALLQSPVTFRVTNN